jgi:hypothetical protein
MEANSKVLGVLFKMAGVLPNTPLWYLVLLCLVAAVPLGMPALYYVCPSIMYTSIHHFTLWPYSFLLATQLRGFRKLLATDVWRHLIVNLIKHKSDSLIHKTFVRLCSFALVLLFIGIIQYLFAISLGLTITTDITTTAKISVVLSSLLVFPILLGIALIVAYIMIGLMVAADIEHETVVVYETCTKKGAPINDRSFCKLVDQLRDLQCRMRVHTL